MSGESARFAHKRGVTREVLLLGGYALKIPSLRSWRCFLWGLLANIQEREFSLTGWPELCPVIFSAPGGFLTVMPRAAPLSDGEWSTFNHREFCTRGDGFAASNYDNRRGVTHGDGMEPWGQLACLEAAFSYAVSSIMTRRCPPIDPIAMATAGLVVGAIALIPATLYFEGLPPVADLRPTVAIIVLGLIPTALAAWLRVSTIRSAGSVFMAPVGFQVPVWSMIFGALVLNEDLPLRFFVALCLILAGLAISQWANLRKIVGR